MWSFKSAKQKQADAPPKSDPAPFVVPDYTHGSPYVQANPVYADNLDVDTGHHAYTTVPEQQQETRNPRRYSYPPAGQPPSNYTAYYADSWQRSQRDEHARGEEGFPNPQSNERWVPNPYLLGPNIVNRPQRTPHEYSFLRPFDQQILGARELNGNHFSHATSGQSSEPLKGLSINTRRRSTYRLEPSQFDVATISSDMDGVPVNMTFTSPDVPFPDRSYRLS